MRALNEVARKDGEKDESIQKVYSAIDKAFRAELASHEHHLALTLSALERVASGELNPEQARRLAQDTLTEVQARATNGRAH